MFGSLGMKGKNWMEKHDWCTEAPGPCNNCGRCAGLTACECGALFDLEETNECPVCGRKYIVNNGFVEEDESEKDV